MLRQLLVAIALIFPSATNAETVLLMAEEQGCHWCAKWNAEIGHIYPKTVEGQTAPLKRYDLHGEVPEVSFARRVHFTPTFILVRNGVEVGRIEGYPGEDFFWGLLDMLFREADLHLEQAS